MNSTMAQPRREAMATRGGLSHLLDNFEDFGGRHLPPVLALGFHRVLGGWMLRVEKGASYL